MRILLADDHEVVRRGLRQMLADDFSGADFGEAGSSAETLERLRDGDWDLLILDIHLPGRNGIEVLGEVHERWPRLPVLILSVAPEREYAVRALRKGAAGYLSKQTVATELSEAVRKVLAGGRYITPAVAEHLAADLGAPDDRPPHEQLSARELQTLQMIACGSSIKDIATALSLSEKTVFTYRDRLRQKLGLRSDVELARYALRHRLVD